MIKIEKTETIGWEHAIRGMRNPMNSWDKSDSKFVIKEECKDIYSYVERIKFLDDISNKGPSLCSTFDTDDEFRIGKNDLELMMKLAENGSVHAKYRRMIAVYTDITAPLYWWKEFDTYKVGTVANSCSTMHKIQEKEFTVDDFSTEHLFDIPDLADRNNDIDSDVELAAISVDGEPCYYSPRGFISMTCDILNRYRQLYLKTKDKKFWWQMIQLLPSSYNQKRTVMMNYEVLAGIYIYRKDHKLDEWRDFCKWIESLPYSEIITLNKAGDTGEWREV